jgi:hypothetical protein
MAAGGYIAPVAPAAGPRLVPPLVTNASDRAILDALTEPLGQSELARRSGVAPSTLKNAVKRLETAGACGEGRDAVPPPGRGLMCMAAAHRLAGFATGAALATVAHQPAWVAVTSAASPPSRRAGSRPPTWTSSGRGGPWIGGCRMSGWGRADPCSIAG